MSLVDQAYAFLTTLPADKLLTTPQLCEALGSPLSKDTKRQLYDAARRGQPLHPLHRRSSPYKIINGKSYRHYLWGTSATCGPSLEEKIDEILILLHRLLDRPVGPMAVKKKFDPDQIEQVRSWLDCQAYDYHQIAEKVGLTPQQVRDIDNLDEEEEEE